MTASSVSSQFLGTRTSRIHRLHEGRNHSLVLQRRDRRESCAALARDLFAQHADATGQWLRAEDIVATAAAAGDAAFATSVARHASPLARALAGVIKLLDPGAIVLGGGLSSLPHRYTEVPALWQRWGFSAGSREAVRTKLLPALHGDAS